MPVATTETRITPSRLSSKVAPTMILASWSTSSRIRVAASSTSNSVRSLPPVMETKRPRAPFIEESSISGLAIAASAAVSARFSPEASPVPIIALPISFITARTSAKSRLMSPSLTIRSVMQATPEEILVRDDQEGVDDLMQFVDTLLGKAHAALALELERLGDHANREDAELLRHPSDHR